MKLTTEMRRKITAAARIAAPVFVEQEWEWKQGRQGPFPHKEVYFTPTVEDIVDSLTLRIKQAAPDTIASSSGRLTVRFDPENNEGQIFLSLGYFDLVDPT